MLNRNHLASPDAQVSAGSGGVGRAPRLYLGRAALASLAVGAYTASMLSGTIHCTFAAITHLPCPACGGTRSMHALLHGDLLGALRFNPTAPLLVSLLAVLCLRGIWYTATEGTPNGMARDKLGTWLVRGVVAALVLEVVVWGLRFLGLFGGPVSV